MKKKKSTLCLHTAQFPYGLGEQFIETEITYLAQAFDKIVIIPEKNEGNQRELPNNVEVLFPDSKDYEKTTAIKLLGSWVLSCLSDIIKLKRPALSLLLRNSHKAYNLVNLLTKNNLLEDTIHYTYWFDSAALQLSILKSKGIIKYFVTRAHGYDLYEDRSANKKIPFRNFQLQQVDKVYLISKDGLNYLSNKYPNYKHKYQLSYLGVRNERSTSPLTPKINEYTIVSCSRLIPLKRVELLIMALAQIKHKKIEWIHFGDGPLNKQLRNLAYDILPKNITATFKGQVDNKTIYQFYKCHYVDCFVNTSSMEGLPVTLMEAISFGIPVVACDVNAVNEIANKNTGLLIKPDAHATKIAETLIYVLDNYSRNVDFREAVYSFWEQNFSAKKNYSLFVTKLDKTSNEKTFLP